MVVCWDCVLLFGYVCWKWWYDDVVFNEWIGRVIDRVSDMLIWFVYCMWVEFFVFF